MDLEACVVRRSIRDKLIPSASRPQVMCDATNLAIVPGNFTRAACPEHRPGYMCQGRSYNRCFPASWASVQHASLQQTLKRPAAGQERGAQLSPAHCAHRLHMGSVL